MNDHLHDPIDGYDFGADGDVVPPSDPQFDAWLTKAAPLLNAPPATPRLDMWDAIQAAQATSVAAQSGAIAGVRPLRKSRWIWPLAIAAALLIGVGLDRFALRKAAEPSVTTAQRQPASDPARLYRLAAEQTLGQAEALLTAFRASDIAIHDPAAARQLGAWGREVLSSTRLLIDSPAGDDPQLRPLLDDLELVLVQIIRTSGAPLDSTERAMIDRSVREHDLLPRIRTAVPAGVAGAASDE